MLLLCYTTKLLYDYTKLLYYLTIFRAFNQVTRFTIITDSITNEKMLCAGHGLMPRAALVDFTLTTSMPFRRFLNIISMVMIR